jgi:hypothetical protein
VLENTTVQESEETLSLRHEKEKEKRQLKARKARRAKKHPPNDDLPPNPDGPGRLINTKA